MPDSPDLAPARRRITRSTVVIGLLVAALVAVATGWWWTSRAEAVVFTGRDVSLLPSSLVCDGEEMPFALPDPQDELAAKYLLERPSFVVMLDQVRTCRLSMTIRNEGEHAVRLHDLSSNLFRTRTGHGGQRGGGLGLVVDPAALDPEGPLRDDRLQVDYVLDSYESTNVTLPLSREVEPCMDRDLILSGPLATIDVSYQDHHAVVRSESDITASVAEHDLPCS